MRDGNGVVKTDIEGKPWKPFVTEFVCILFYCYYVLIVPHAVPEASPTQLLYGRPLNTKLNIIRIAHTA